jgi:hypothetical protein
VRYVEALDSSGEVSFGHSSPNFGGVALHCENLSDFSAFLFDQLRR